MKVTVIGTGYVGLIAGLGFADGGNEVICLDVNKTKIDMLNNGRCPIYEPGAEVLLARNIRMARIRFTTDKELAIRHGDIIFIAVGTPEGNDGHADMQYVWQAARDIGQYMDRYTVIVDKSTVPIGTSRMVYKYIKTELDKRKVKYEFSVVSNPEFLREGKAVGDFMNPDRIIIGVEDEKAEKLMRKLYHVFTRSQKPLIVTAPETAEMIKYASNAFLATKITFINEIANLCDAVGANVLEVASAMGADGRISPKFLHAGPGYGGSCFPKDTKALVMTGQEYGIDMSIVRTVVEANEKQKVLAAKKVLEYVPKGSTVGILGLAFKPETDDMREAPSLTVIKELVATGFYLLKAFDPESMEAAKEMLPYNILWCDSAKEVIEGSDAIVILTEWGEFRSIDAQMMVEHMHPDGKVFDFRHIFNRREIEEAGLKYYGLGF